MPLMHLLEMNNTLVYAHKIQIYGSNYTFHLKSSIFVSRPFLKNASHIIPKKYETYVFKHFDICDMHLH